MTCQRSSVVEQLFRKEQVVGSIPTVGSNNLSPPSFNWSYKYRQKSLYSGSDRLTPNQVDIPSAFSH